MPIENNNPQNNNIYNNSIDFKEQCLPAIITLKQYCMSRGIPFYMTFAVSNSEKETEYITSKQFPPECETVLKDDRFRKIILAEHGFDLMINHVDAFDMDDLTTEVTAEASKAPKTGKKRGRKPKKVIETPEE